MLRQNKGISIISLIVVIVVLLIIAGVTFHFTKDLMYESTLKNNITNMLLVQARIEIIHDKNQFDEGTQLVGENLNITDDEYENEYKKYNINKELLQTKVETSQNDEGETTTTTTLSKWYKWEKKDGNSAKEELEDLKVDLKDGEYYLINYETGEVIYSKGYRSRDEECVIYSLNEMEDLQNSGGM